jgi:polysaccharide chain length determinant protein (PEP-CTERM system associated)
MIGHRQLSMEDYVAILKRRKWDFVLPLLIAPIAAYLLCFVVPKQYTSQTTVLVQQPAVSQSDVTSAETDDLNRRLATMQEQILSRSRLEPVIDKLGLYSGERGQVPMEDLVNRLRKKIVISPVKPITQLRDMELPGFTVKVSFHDPALAQKICNEVTSMFMGENLKIRQTRAEDTTTFLTRQVADAKASLDDQDAKLAAFKSRYIGSLPDDEQANLSLLTGLNTQLDASTQALSRAQQDKAFAESMLSQQTAALQASQAGGNPESLQKQLSDAQAELASLQGKYTDDYPDVMKVKRNIADLQQQIAASGGSANTVPSQGGRKAAITSPELEQLRAQVHQYDSLIHEKTAQQKDLQRQIALYQSRIQLSPTVEEQYKQLTRDHQTALDFYNDLLKKRSESAVASDLQHRQESDQFRVIDAPNLPDSPSFPNPLYFVLGGVAAGIVLGIGFTLLFEARDKTLRTEKDVEFFLQLPTLALIPSVESMRDGKLHGTRATASGLTGA